jgi:hypothetical protein
MRSIILAVILCFSFFFIGTIDIKAVNYSYEITSMKLDSTKEHIIIKGWAIYRPNILAPNLGREVHNVNPTFRLYIRNANITNEPGTKDGLVDFGSVSTNVGREPSTDKSFLINRSTSHNSNYSNISDDNTATSTFFSTQYYMAYAKHRQPGETVDAFRQKCESMLGVYGTDGLCRYPPVLTFWQQASSSKRFKNTITRVIQDTEAGKPGCTLGEQWNGPCGNAVYINNDFEFRIPIDKLEEHFSKNPNTTLSLRLRITQAASSNVPIYGVAGFNLTSFDIYVIGLVAHPETIATAVLGEVEIDIKYDKLKVNATDGFIQASQTRGLRSFSCQNGNDYAYNGPYRPHAKFVLDSEYTVVGKVGFIDQAYIRSVNPIPIGMYPIYASFREQTTGSCWASAVGNLKYIVGDGTRTGYLPSVWANPGTGTFMRLTPSITDPCDKYPKDSERWDCCKQIYDETDDNSDKRSERLYLLDTTGVSAACPFSTPGRPPTECNFSDALRQYCCLHYDMHGRDPELCEREFGILPREDKNLPARENQCPFNHTEELIEEFKEPKTPDKGVYRDSYGIVQVTYDSNGFTLPNTDIYNKNNNSACTISCQEILEVKFKSMPHVKAGMGFDYPVPINGRRICGAIYHNDAWTASMNTAVANAKIQYDKMVDSLKKAHNAATACGTKVQDRYSYVLHGPSGEILTGSCSNTCVNGGCVLWESTPTCDQCGPTYNYTTYNQFAINITSNIFSEYLTNKPGIPGNYFAFNTKGRIFAQNTTGDDEEEKDPCACTSCTIPTTWCPRQNCIVYSCSNSPYSLWSNAQEGIYSHLNDARNAKIEHDRWVRYIRKLETDRRTCDNWVYNNTYSFTTTITTKDVPNQTSYVIEINNYDPDVASFNATRIYRADGVYKKRHEPNECTWGSHGVSRNTPNYLQFGTGYFDRDRYCIATGPGYTEFLPFFEEWVRLSTRDTVYEFSNYYYVHKYTGDVSLVRDYYHAYVPHGRYAYTGFFDKSDVHPFELRLTGIGPNITTNKTWAISPLNCRYEVINWIFPPADDYQREAYGSVTFRFRQISLEEPFPNRIPGANWQGHIDKIYAPKSVIPYQVVLTPATRQDIRQFNLDNRYDYASYNRENPEISTFIRDDKYLGIYKYQKKYQ